MFDQAKNATDSVINDNGTILYFYQGKNLIGGDIVWVVLYEKKGNVYEKFSFLKKDDGLYHSLWDYRIDEIISYGGKDANQTKRWGMIQRETLAELHSQLLASLDSWMLQHGFTKIKDGVYQFDELTPEDRAVKAIKNICLSDDLYSDPAAGEQSPTKKPQITLYNLKGDISVVTGLDHFTATLELETPRKYYVSDDAGNTFDFDKKLWGVKPEQTPSVVDVDFKQDFPEGQCDIQQVKRLLNVGVPASGMPTYYQPEGVLTPSDETVELCSQFGEAMAEPIVELSPAGDRTHETQPLHPASERFGSWEQTPPAGNVSWEEWEKALLGEDAPKPDPLYPEDDTHPWGTTDAEKLTAPYDHWTLWGETLRGLYRGGTVNISIKISPPEKRQ